MFGKELKKLRLKAALTQEEVAASAGVTREYVSMIESGKNSPTIQVFIRLCRAVKASPDEIVAKLDKAMPARSSRR